MDQLRVLVADDNRDTVLTLGILLRSEGYDVHLAENAEQALAEASAFRPDVVLLDIGLPDRSGFDVAQELWRRYGHDCPVLVAVTARTQAEDRERAETSGFHHFFSKPYDPQALLLFLDSLSLQA
jgi:two-component system CheB/CheR fusion protein